jgi:hypothetical protein
MAQGTHRRQAAEARPHDQDSHGPMSSSRV